MGEGTAGLAELDIEIVRAHVASAEEAMASVGGFVGMHPTSPDDYSPIAEIELPDTPTYRLVGFDAGADLFDVTPNDALSQILDRGRSPLTIDEGIAVLLHSPDVLAESAFSLLGLRRDDRRVPAL